jgi:hypothetical protein
MRWGSFAVRPSILSVFELVTDAIGYLKFGSAHPSNPASTIIKRPTRRCLSISRVFTLEYCISSEGNTNPFHHPRISSEGNTNPFPAPLLDALAGYTYLVDTLGFLPQNTVFTGDSAGGNLALPLVRYILDHVAEADFPLRPPTALLLFSPWADISDSHYALVSPAQRQADFLALPTSSNEGWLAHAARMYAGRIPPDQTKTNPYFSPASLGIAPDEAHMDSSMGFRAHSSAVVVRRCSKRISSHSRIA